LSDKKRTSDALEILHARLVADDPEMQELLEDGRLRIQIAEKAYDLRTAAGLFQEELAARASCSVDAIHDIEAADYEGDSLAMFRRLASAVHHQVEVQVVPLAQKAA
jgi:ribosome-binding protein aMBF1 (putative translation factor)